MKVTLAVELPEEVAQNLPRTEPDLADVLALGLREWKRRGMGEFGSLTAVMETLAEQPPPEQIIALRPSPEMQARVNDLLEKNRSGQLTPEEERELKQHEFLEHIVRLAKLQAA